MVRSVGALAFRPRLERIDARLLQAAQRHGQRVETLAEALQQPAASLFELFPAEDWLPTHYGKVARSLWSLVDLVFKAADSPRDCPPGFSAKSVQVADIYELPPRRRRTDRVSGPVG